MNGWAKLIIGVAISILGMGGTFVLGTSYDKGRFDTHVSSEGHPKLIHRVTEIEREIARADERQKAILKALERIEGLVRNAQ